MASSIIQAQHVDHSKVLTVGALTEKGGTSQGQGNFHAITKPDLRFDPWWSIDVLRCMVMPHAWQATVRRLPP